MKPLPPVPLTDEDKLIVALLDVSYAGRHDMVAARSADRRDANAMYRWEEDRRSIYPAHLNPIERIQTAMAIYRFSGPFFR